MELGSGDFPSGCAACLSARQAPDRYPCTLQVVTKIYWRHTVDQVDQDERIRDPPTTLAYASNLESRPLYNVNLNGPESPDVMNARFRDGDHYIVSNPMSTWLGVE